MSEQCNKFATNLVLAIVGPPKTGTSSLYHWLSEHPQLCGSQPKETFFFMDKDHPLAQRQISCNKPTFHSSGLEAYNSFFRTSSTDTGAFEITTHYYYQRTAIEQLSGMESQPIIAFVLRRPSERLYSSFRYTQQNLSLSSSELSFNNYVELLLTNNVSELDKYFLDSSSLWIAKEQLRLGKYVDWLRCWKEHIDASRLHLMYFEDIRKNPLSVLSGLAKRLNIDPNFWNGKNFDSRNRTVQVRSNRMHRFARSLGSKLPKNTLRSVLAGIYSKVQYTHNPSGKEDTHSLGLDRLDRYFDPWNNELAAEFNVNVKTWQSSSDDDGIAATS